MADDRERNQGMKQDTGGAHEAPGRNPQDDRSAGGQQGGQEKGGQQDQQGQQGGGVKEGGQNEQTRR
jgi:hypothetical protein